MAAARSLKCFMRSKSTHASPHVYHRRQPEQESVSPASVRVCRRTCFVAVFEKGRVDPTFVRTSLKGRYALIYLKAPEGTQGDPRKILAQKNPTILKKPTTPTPSGSRVGGAPRARGRGPRGEPPRRAALREGRRGGIRAGARVGGGADKRCTRRSWWRSGPRRPG